MSEDSFFDLRLVWGQGKGERESWREYAFLRILFFHKECKDNVEKKCLTVGIFLRSNMNIFNF